MEAILAGNLAIDPAISLRTALYRALSQVWRDGEARAADAADQSPPDYRLQVLSPVQRAVLLLTSMEGFTASEAAQVLDLDLADLNQHLAAAEEALERQLATDVLIIEDEPIIGLDLMRLTRELGHRVTGVAATRDEAVEMAGRQRPGLVLSDIRLADGSSGLDAATDILKSFDIPVIFITAFPERLLTGERPEPAFLITKPFREDTVKALIGQALFFHRPQPAMTSAE